MTTPDASMSGGAVLGIDTATSFLALAAIATDGSVLAERTHEVGRDHAARIVPELQGLLADGRIAPKHVRGIAVGIGPGSYTGLRIGIAAAKGLAFGWSVPVGGSDTLGAIAHAALAPGETGIAAIDARRGNVYFGVYHRGSAGATALGRPAKAARDAVADRHPGLRIVMGLAPSAVWHARRFDPASSVEAVYL